MSWKEEIKKEQQIDIKDYTELLEKLRQLAQKHNPNAMAHVDKLQEELLHLNTERQYGRLVQKKEVKKNYVGYGRDMAEMSARSEQMQEDLAQMTQDLIHDLQQAISSGKVTDGKLKSIYKKHGIKFNLMDFMGE